MAETRLDRYREQLDRANARARSLRESMEDGVTKAASVALAGTTAFGLGFLEGKGYEVTVLGVKTPGIVSIVTGVAAMATDGNASDYFLAMSTASGSIALNALGKKFAENTDDESDSSDNSDQ